MDPLTRHRVEIHGTRSPDAPTVLFGHGLGGNQGQWSPIVAALADSVRCVTFTLAGSPGADPSAFSPARHSSLYGFADDIAAIAAALDTPDLSFVGHSMSGMAGTIAVAADPTLFSRMIMINASPRYLDDPASGYTGGFSQEQVDEVLAAIAQDFSRWAAGFGPVMMGNPDVPAFADEFTSSLAAYAPEVASVVFRAAFTGDYRGVVPRVATPTLLLQSQDDPAVPAGVDTWLLATLHDARLAHLAARGHFPHVVDPDEVTSQLRPFLLADR